MSYFPHPHVVQNNLFFSSAEHNRYFEKCFNCFVHLMKVIGSKTMLDFIDFHCIFQIHFSIPQKNHTGSDMMTQSKL